ncbi:FKBP-type peptidyl-prolyl cis-trans isomerase [Algoriphagus aquimarinus]|uniref:Peptidyl-prolyl cis-trans isomerase n=1 Tax=Algoriphagus aquimarinus TaxID=237018 RepID=A0A1I1CFG4_9BACT|nr:FKBP-type peptidyl-prolyl cis-trans isomerase [Algoriphagus aquimarinus]SFB60746.1 FKBP-type peptidyl-prolyl cis-trans isomerase FklB [Algoriphagus aquimarinus]|tara:strand:- start:17264 stop:17815 length:552 start_codon:yes stop_codon:yes gene_type:complete
MKIRIFAILSLIAGSFAMASCIDEEATDDVILSKDKTAIEEYIASNTLVNVKEFYDETSGLRVIWQEVSDSGMGVTAGDTLKVDYTGKLLSNKVFDTSIKQVAVDEGIFSSSRVYTPLDFPVGFNLLIPGFEFGVGQMEQGDKATVFIPSMFAYGKQGSGSIPSNAPIIFELNLIEVTQGPQQ